MHALLIPDGGAGYVLPFVKLGGALLQRGHRVTLAASNHFQAVAEREGLEFVASYSAEEHSSYLLGQPSFFTMWKYRRFLWEHSLKQTKRIYDIIAARHVPGETVVATLCWVFGARLAQEKMGVPLATIYLQPSLLGSLRPKVPNWLHWLGARAIERFLDRRLGAGLNAIRADLDLPPISRLLHWWNSPQRVIGLFPAWFCPPQKYWPTNTRLVGFPILAEEPAPGDDLDAFVSAGEAPLVFSQASLRKETQAYYAEAVEAAVLLGRRAVLLTSSPDQVPATLPPGVRAFGFVPFRLPRAAAAHIHHGGIGTIAYTLALGAPQLTLPAVFDQHSNCQWLHRLGVSDSIRPRAFKAATVARKLKALLDSSAVAESCRLYAARCREENGLQGACDLLEELHAGSRGG
jgi:UDP:flavonoid glycosyltransferase YjiC (YdhE family)